MAKDKDESKDISDTKARTLFLVGGVDEDMSREVLQSMHKLEAKSHADIVVYLSSGGGDVDSGLAIYDSFITSPCKVICIAYGHCQSMASVIMQACHTRLLSPNTTFQIHDGSIGMGRVHTKEFIETAKYFERQALQIDNIMAERTGLSLTQIQEMSKFSTHMTPGEAVQLGFADGVLIRDPKVYKPSKNKKVKNKKKK